MTKNPKSPDDLLLEAEKLWDSVLSDFDLGQAEIEILRVACLSLSEFLEARQGLSEQGLTFRTASGQIKQNPLILIEKVAGSRFLSAMNSLSLEYRENPKANIGRPGGRYI